MSDVDTIQVNDGDNARGRPHLRQRCLVLRDPEKTTRDLTIMLASEY